MQSVLKPKMGDEKKLKLHSGNEIPAIGFGCAAWGTDPNATSDLFDKKFQTAFNDGYR